MHLILQDSLSPESREREKKKSGRGKLSPGVTNYAQWQVESEWLHEKDRFRRIRHRFWKGACLQVCSLRSSRILWLSDFHRVPFSFSSPTNNVSLSSVCVCVCVCVCWRFAKQPTTTAQLISEPNFPMVYTGAKRLEYRPRRRIINAQCNIPAYVTIVDWVGIARPRARSIISSNLSAIIRVQLRLARARIETPTLRPFVCKWPFNDQLVRVLSSFLLGKIFGSF